MKKFTTLITAAAIVAASTAFTAAQAAQTIKAEVNGMVCAFCAQGIDKKMRALSQTKDVYVNLKQKIVAVEIKEGQTLSPDTVRDLVKEAGYDVTRIQTVQDSVPQIKAAMKSGQGAFNKDDK